MTHPEKMTGEAIGKKKYPYKDATTMMMQCIQCDMFEFCFRDEITFRGNISSKNRKQMVEKLFELAKVMKVRPLAEPEFVHNMAFFISWLLQDDRKTYQCHHDVPQEIPGIKTDMPIYSPDLSKDLSSLRKSGLITVGYEEEEERLAVCCINKGSEAIFSDNGLLHTKECIEKEIEYLKTHHPEQLENIKKLEGLIREERNDQGRNHRTR